MRNDTAVSPGLEPSHGYETASPSASSTRAWIVGTKRKAMHPTTNAPTTVHAGDQRRARVQYRCSHSAATNGTATHPVRDCERTEKYAPSPSARNDVAMN